MYAINKKSWSEMINSHKSFEVTKNLLSSSRFWAVISLIFLSALAAAAIVALVMLSFWAAQIDLSGLYPDSFIN